MTDFLKTVNKYTCSFTVITLCLMAFAIINFTSQSLPDLYFNVRILLNLGIKMLFLSSTILHC